MDEGVEMTAAKSPRTLSEAHIQRTCSDWLALDNWRAIITDPPQLRGLGVTEKGIPDRLYIRYTQHCLKPYSCPDAEVLWIEWKRMKGNIATKATTEQWEWHRLERKRGALTVIAGVEFPATIEGFQAWYRASGLMRGKI